VDTAISSSSSSSSSSSGGGGDGGDGGGGFALDPDVCSAVVMFPDYRKQ